MKKPNIDKIWKAKIKYYGNTHAAFDFAQEEFNRQLLLYYKEIGKYLLGFGFYVLDDNGTLVDPAMVKGKRHGKVIHIDDSGRLSILTIHKR